MEVALHPDGEAELRNLPATERRAMHNAIEKLQALGDQLPYPHSSAVKGARSLRELRPRQGRSPWRAFYRRMGDVMVIGSIGSEAEADAAGFERAVRSAAQRLDDIERDEAEQPATRDSTGQQCPRRAT